ncbi:MAG: thioredoxin domain-containing protein [Myxococcota bacterium]
MTSPDRPHTNRLIHETSPYLLQHAHNPIDWFPWGEEAHEKAASQDKPIFLSVGYSACHWCHVMERESFEDEAIAALLNEHFVSIKVDREERPDVDAIYMDAVQLVTGSGGWPMSVWLDTRLRPFYAGTYFPPEDRWGRPGFRSVLEQILEAWEGERARLDEASSELTARLDAMAAPRAGEDPLTRVHLVRAFEHFDRTFDSKHGGFSARGPKFPTPGQLDLLLLAGQSVALDPARRARALELVEVTLTRMASGGMVDHLAGGFHRYSVDERWLIPHFEKMLYDNAQLTSTFVDAHLVTGKAFYADVAARTLEYVLAEMTDPDTGAFYATQDADSEGVEGKFFVWTPGELVQVLGAEDGAFAADYWGVSEEGNFEHGASALHRLHHLDARGHFAAHDPEDDRIAELRAKLRTARRGRVAPATDTKIIAAWNGLMIGAMARAGMHLGAPRYVEAAARAARFILDTMIQGSLEDEDFQLMRIHKDGRTRIPGYLEDYAAVARALLEVHEATHDVVWVEHALRLTRRMIATFGDEDGVFFTAGADRGDLIVRQKDTYDGATPSGNGVALDVLLRLSALTGDASLRARVDRALHTLTPAMSRAPHGFSGAVRANTLHLRGMRELVIVHSDEAPADELLDVARGSWVPGMVRIVAPSARVEELAQRFGVLEGRALRGAQPTAYVCAEGVCKLPVTTAQELRALLREAPR